MRDQPWAADALCVQADPDIFYPERGRVLRWVPRRHIPTLKRDDLHRLVACPTCHARVDETCRSDGTRADGARPRRTPHLSRLAPRLCACGARLEWKRKVCDWCRDEANRANKRDYMRRLRARGEAS
jgi:hypothetical protein